MPDTAGQPPEAQGRITRRELLKKAGAGAIGLGVAGSAAPFSFAGPLRYQGRWLKGDLSIIQWVHFVPAYDDWFDNTWVKQWGQANDVQVKVEHINNTLLDTRAAAEVAAQSGHDLFFNLHPMASYEDQVINHASIVHEIETLHRTWGHRGFMFYDDELNVNKGLVGLMRELVLLQERLGVEFRLRGFVKAELFTDEQAEAMYLAGFRWILVGFEAGSPRILENIGKRATRDDNTRCVDIARRHGLKVKALMSLGHPGESEATASDLHDWLLETRPDDFDCTIITTYPGTPYYDEAVPEPYGPGVYTYMAKSGDRLHALDVDFSRVADYYKGDPNGGYQAFVYTDSLSREGLVQARDWVERDVRRVLGIAYNLARPAQRFEHSMGMGPLPPFIVRTSALPAEVAP